MKKDLRTNIFARLWQKLRGATTTTRPIKLSADATGRTAQPAATQAPGRFGIEPLEGRIAPASIVLLDGDNQLRVVDTANPDTAGPALTIVGLLAGDKIVGFDFRPSDHKLYAVVDGTASDRIYTIDLITGAALPVAELRAETSDTTSPFTALAGTHFGVAFNASTDRIHVVNEAGQNLRINPGTGRVTTDTALDWADDDPNETLTLDIVSAAFSNSILGAASGTFFGIDAAQNVLVSTTSPTGGLLNTVGSLGFDISGLSAFDIQSTVTGQNGYAVLQTEGGTSSALYSINLETGAATLISNLGGSMQVRGMAVSFAKATVLEDGRTATYTDLDGDIVTISISKGRFDSTDFTLVEGVNGYQLASLNLNNDGTEFSGANITITAKTPVGGTGDGKVHVGHINATGTSLGKVVVEGDLAQIDAGNNNIATGVKSLTVDSMGGVSNTQAPGATDRESRITGGLGLIKTEFVVGSYIHVVSGTSIFGTPTAAIGKIGTVDIAHYLKAGTENAGTLNDGLIQTDAGISVLMIGSGERPTETGAIADGIIGGLGVNSGAVVAGGNIGKVIIDGDVRGGGGATGSGAGSGSITAKGDIGSIVVKGTVIGGGSASSGILHADGDILSVTVGTVLQPGLKGGSGDGSGVISAGEVLGTVKIYGDVEGVGSHSGGISAGTILRSLSINGSLKGGAGLGSGFIEGYDDLQKISITGNVLGGDGIDSGSIAATGDILSLTIGGELKAGTKVGSGSVFAGIDGVSGIGTLRIGQTVTGGEAASSGAIVVGGKIKDLLISNNLQATTALDGGVGDFSGSIQADTISKLRIYGAVEGGTGKESGSIVVTSELTSAEIRGTLTGGFGASSGSIMAKDRMLEDGPAGGRLAKVVVKGAVTGGEGADSGQIRSAGDIGSVSLGNVTAGTGARSGHILAGTGLVGVGNISSVTAAMMTNVEVVSAGSIGSLTAGGLDEVAIRAGNHLGTLKVTENVVDSLISARGQAVQGRTTDCAFSSITIGGSISGSQILAGYDIEGNAVNADAQIKTVTVGVNWTASDLIAGVIDAEDGVGFGDDDDAMIEGGSADIIASIAKLTIKGTVTGTDADDDHFGIVAEEVKTVSVAKIVQATRPVAPLQEDVAIREV